MKPNRPLWLAFIRAHIPWAWNWIVANCVYDTTTQRLIRSTPVIKKREQGKWYTKINGVWIIDGE
jgi:hypothetical protein